MNKEKNTPNVDFSFVRYANCWEDANLLINSLLPTKGKRILSIASAGDNSLSMLIAGAEVVAADLNPSQLACVELRKEAIRILSQKEFLQFSGIEPDDNREQTYLTIRPALTHDAQLYWDSNSLSISDGFIHMGKFENYFKLFRKRILPLIHSKRIVNKLIEPKTEEERKFFYKKIWNNYRWRLLFKIFFSRKMMGSLGRDPEFFRHVEGKVSERIFERAEYGLTELDIADNPYLTYVLTGNFKQALPHYLRPENYNAIQKNIDNLTIKLGAIDAIAEEYGPGSFDGYNLSDIFEYLSPEQCVGVYSRLLDNTRPQARFAYWNMLVPRTCPEDLADKIILLTDKSKSLFLEDQAVFYSRFVLEEVL